MNTSRDIEKLFDHFGGNAGDYQEIGRENEARTARTRWPLLATLDFAQPAIPEIAPRRDTHADAERALRPESTDTPAEPDKPTPILRGRQQLFTRAHRRTIPPVNPPAAESLSALRFSVLGEAASKEEEAVTPAASVAPVAAKPVESEKDHQPATFGSNFLARRAPVQAPPAVTAPRAPEPAPAQAASPSILGQLFRPQAQPAPSAPAGSLDAMFDRLRHARPHAGDSTNTNTNTHASAEHARASRLSRS